MNEPALRVSGVSRDEVIGRPFWDCYWWSYDPGVQARLREAVRRAAAHEVVRYDADVRIRDGELLSIDFQLAPHCDASGRVIAIVPSGIDIADRKAAQASLIATRQTFESAIKACPFGILVVDGDFRISLLSAGAEESLRNLPSAIGRDFCAVVREIWSDPFASEIIDAYRTTLRTGEPFVSLRSVDRRADTGATESYDWRLLRTRMPDDRHGVICYFYDLSERNRIGAALAESEVLFRATFDNVAVGMAHVDRNGRWLRANSKLCEILGYDRAELYQLDFQSVTHPDDLQLDLDHFGKMLAGEIDDYRIEKRYLRKDGTPVWILLTVGSVRTPEGDIDFVIAAVEDISEKKQGEDLRQILVEELHHRVKNLLSTIQSVASHTIRASADLPDFRERFLGRLQSISIAHDAIFDTDTGTAELAGLIRGQMETYLTESCDRIAVDGPSILLDPGEANAFGILMHELLTNAMKYGALTSKDGTIAVTWSIAGEEPDAYRVALDWVESGGPPAKEPERTGFGSRLIESTVNLTLSGALERRYGQDGFRCSMTLRVGKHDGKAARPDPGR